MTHEGQISGLGSGTRSTHVGDRLGATLAIVGDPRGHTKPFNIAGYAPLTHMLAQQAGLMVGDFVRTGGDCHLHLDHLDHLDQAREQLSREPGTLPWLEIMRRWASIDAYEEGDFVLHDYAAQPHIKAPVAV